MWYLPTKINKIHSNIKLNPTYETHNSIDEDSNKHIIGEIVRQVGHLRELLNDEIIWEAEA